MNLNGENIDGLTLNICNDTYLECREGDKNIILFNSIAIYRSSKGECIRMAGQFLNNNNYLTKVNDSLFVYKSTGDFCKNNTNFTTLYKFKNTTGRESVEYMKIVVPYSYMNEACDRTLEINVNFASITDQLLIQKFFSNYHYVTGVLFILIGLYLLIFAKIKRIS